MHSKCRTSLIENSQVSSIVNSNVHDAVRNHDIVYIVDGTPPAPSSANCVTILATSARSIIYKQFIKARNTPAVLATAPWSVREFPAVNAQFPLRNNGDLIFSFEVLGGVPQYVLSQRPVRRRMHVFACGYSHVRWQVWRYCASLHERICWQGWCCSLQSACTFGAQCRIRDCSNAVGVSLRVRSTCSATSTLLAKTKKCIQSSWSLPQCAASCALLTEFLLHDALLPRTSEMASLKHRSARMPIRLSGYQITTVSSVA